ncbi:amidohydrolase [Amphibacillus cookii]|uniref:amidohydrolase n=1 Tax=Amphibacillus cookii TaxID=767787 RepID=UPI001957E567|nr:amidohydrolase [Amphibacillus cookii]MBM7543032.1 putative amidohydrolase YtcJ [Amphibacillus cookii]
MGTLWFGGTFYTMCEVNDTVEAVYTHSGRILKVGTYQRLKAQFKSDIEEEVDLTGKYIFPGFVDSHLHIIGQGEKLAHLDLSACMSAAEVLACVRERVKSMPSGHWLFGEGWNDNQWNEQRIIDCKELDDISTHHPIVLTRVCRHALIANTKAIELAQLTEGVEDPQGGKVIRDDNNRMTGYFLDTAQDLIKQAVPDRSTEELKQLIDLSIDYLLRLGLVGGHSEDLAYYGKGSFDKVSQAYKQSIDGDARKFRAHLLVHHDVIDDFAKQSLRYKEGTPFVEYGAMKIFADGALGGRTAWLEASYHDDPSNTGLAIHTNEELESLIAKARSLQLPVAVHAIGDGAINIVAQLLVAYPLAQGYRDRIIHAMIVNQPLINKLSKLNVVLDIQPTFVSSDFPWVIQRLGSERVKTAYPWRTFLDHGIACAAGSDAPIEDVNPLYGIEAFVERRSTIDQQIYNAEQQLTVYQAISLYTKGSAYVIGKEQETGLIKEGYLADFTILEQDPFQVEKHMIHKINVGMTVVDGTIVYHR